MRHITITGTKIYFPDMTRTQREESCIFFQIEIKKQFAVNHICNNTFVTNMCAYDNDKCS